MRTGRRSTDWQTAQTSQPEGERRGEDRRAQDRRAPRRPVDPLFAATLVSQMSPDEDVVPARAISYFTAPAPAPRRKRALNLHA